ncbi:MAG: hypothetical protein KF748_01165 [Xanthobacteraceae bacterium]|nr:hypothetical protein [Xanthobacteraceae bacterium]MBX3547742.1 hypothetical protein [Xanthobacteraceae bacterium]
MPRKRRFSKRNLSTESELEIWGPVFECGHTFTGDLDDVGVIDPAGIIPPDQKEAVTAAFMSAARDAWKRLGPTFLEQTDRKDLWAVKQFGEPSCR